MLWGCIPLTLLALAHASLSATQVAWNSDPAIQSTTLVDVLNADEDYSYLLSLLQKAKLIPTLNKLNGSTFFAPTNDAVKRHAQTNDLWGSALEYPDLLKDNVQEELRQQLFYHLLNYSVTQIPNDLTTRVLDTLHYPKLSLDPPANEPLPSLPWIPLPESTLGNKSQKLRLTSREGVAWVGVDAFGKGGIEIKKERVDAANGVVYGISQVLEVPPHLGRVLSQQSSLSYFQKILTPNILHVINSTSELTLFMPVDSAWKTLHPLERLYLESEFAADDLLRILNMHAVVEKRVRWSDSLDSTTTLTTEYGSQLEVAVSEGKTTVSGATLEQPDIYASNGVLHLVSSLLVPPGALQLTPEKYLLALNCTSFISLIHSVNLTHLINDTKTHYTILAPKDDVLSGFEHDGLPKEGSDELKRMLQYHFLPGKWTPKKLVNDMLLESVLQEPGLDDGRQVMHVEVNDDGKKDVLPKHIRFGGAGIIGEHIEINNTVVYFISRPLEPPVDPLQTALPSLDLSSFLAAIFSTSIAEVIKKTPRATFLIPHNAAFKRLGMLVSDHLLAASSKTDLENVIMHHIIDGIEYSQSVVNGSQRTFATLEGSDLQLERPGNGSIIVSASGGWAGMKSALYPKNMLTETGVIHELSDIMIPRSVELNVGKLMKAAKATTMINMVTKAGFDWILNGTAPPEGSEWAEQGLSGSSWTLLCPTDDAFKKYNLTDLFENIDDLRAIVSQHLIPTSPSAGESFDVFDVLNNNRPLPLENLGEYSTLLSPSSAYGDIVFRALDDKVSKYMVGIKNARGTDKQADWARVLTWGRATTGGGTGGVITLDRMLIPYHPPWWIEYLAPSFVGALGIGLICLFFYAVRIVWRRDATEATYEPSSEAPAVEETKNSAIDNVKSFIAGGFGGVSAVLVGHPFDLTKTRLQTAAPGAYTGAIDVVKKTVARDGVTGLYRGMVPPLLGVTPIFAVSFWAYDASKSLILALTPKRTSERLSTAELAAAGFMSAVPTTLITAPVERAKVLLQVQGQGGSGPQYKGVFDVMKHLYREGGIRSIFRGTGATIARDGPGSAVYFAAYEVTKKALTPAGSSAGDLNLGVVMFAGGTAGVAMWSIAIPPDVLKSRIQSAPSGTYSGLFDCFRKTVARDGITALWKGLGPAMARAFPANAATFSSSQPRSLSASEIARNLSNFETWSTHQCCEQVSLSDLPPEFQEDVGSLFGITKKIPSLLSFDCSPGFAKFIADASKAAPELFSDDVTHASNELFEDVCVVFSAWKRLAKMRNSKEKWSEADFVANVYNVFRTSAIRESTFRVQCAVSLPQPQDTFQNALDVPRVLNTKTVIPDCAIFIPASRTRPWSHSAKSPYKLLKNHPAVVKAGNAAKMSSFRYQSTPCAQLPDMPGFEFASSFWEDKKPIHALLDDAYRQNRMSTTAAVRHLHSLGIHAPVTGLIWADGVVRAHVDWCEESEGKTVVMSAPYHDPHNRSPNDVFHEWKLDRPSDMLQIYFLVRNIDQWTTGKFSEYVVRGVNQMVDKLSSSEMAYKPWKRVGDLAPPLKNNALKENHNISVTTVVTSDASPSPPKPKNRRRRRRSSN
ncbi:uncharacterized protein EDB91DRAFT_1235288 [Suillus paluster]|uniref:uncharacterized protein n=1 Tax=Suillus paluster TaxID=48578 RepID=UPI001B8616BA|nr:uncharacterized protein EDB91DRAFT_1235288 [Suillus paluster]KAG1749841.1 hypothetical protein EDB91DRAFT_1235288 [Suillus paluster]